MRDGRTLVPADVADTGLQQRLRDGENTFAVEALTGAKLKVAHFP
jgi:hypothetical protein